MLLVNLHYFVAVFYNKSEILNIIERIRLQPNNLKKVKKGKKSNSFDIFSILFYFFYFFLYEIHFIDFIFILDSTVVASHNQASEKPLLISRKQHI